MTKLEVPDVNVHDHQWSAWATIKEPTASATGIEERRCTVCGVTEQRVIPKIAKVSKKGVIKGKAKGTCYVHAYAQNGVYSRIKITVR